MNLFKWTQIHWIPTSNLNKKTLQPKVLWKGEEWACVLKFLFKKFNLRFNLFPLLRDVNAEVQNTLIYSTSLLYAEGLLYCTGQ